jgi:hypothetical protein
MSPKTASPVIDYLTAQVKTAAEARRTEFPPFHGQFFAWHQAQAQFYRRLLKHGTPFVGCGDSSDYSEVAASKRRHRPRPKECFSNALRLLADCPAAAYFEGFIVFPYSLIPNDLVQHAWNVMPDGTVIDLTAEVREALHRRRSRKKLADPSNYHYFGVCIPRQYLGPAFEEADAQWRLPSYLESLGENRLAAVRRQ